MWRAVEPFVEPAPDAGRMVDDANVGAPREAVESRRMKIKDVSLFGRNARHLVKGGLQRAGGAVVALAESGGENQDPEAHDFSETDSDP